MTAGNATSMAVVAAGAVTCVGMSWASSSAAIRACLDGFAETEFIDELGEPLIGARVQDHALELKADVGLGDAITGGNERLAAMVRKAAAECALRAGGLNPAETALVLLGAEATRPGTSLDQLQDCYAACERAIGHRFHADSQILQGGSAGLAPALQKAQQLLQDKGLKSVLLVGVDSLLNTSYISEALQRQRLLTSTQSDGHIPGEAAVCLLLTAMPETPRLPVLRIDGCAWAHESDNLEVEKPSRGKALAQATVAALKQAGLKAQDIHSRWSDVSGESYFAEEASYAWSRVLRSRSPQGYQFMAPANRVGNVGAAAGPLMLATALDAARKAWAPGAFNLYQFSSASTPRSAVVTSTA